ncbi:MAG: alpha/beta hydrolase [Clostridiales bacterium]|nr:alpha/beta hydrolase [Clostridiales bacterium]
MTAENCGAFHDDSDNIIEYYTCGDPGGYPVLYMHGATPVPFTGELASFVRQKGIFALTILRPGYGKSTPQRFDDIFSYAQALEPFLDQLELSRFDVMGLSAGAPHCYAMCAAYPGRVGEAHICAGIPLANNRLIYSKYSKAERFMFSLSKCLPPGLIGRYGVAAMEAMERKKGWIKPPYAESMDEVFKRYVRPNWLGIGLSTRLQYKNWGFDAEKIAAKVNVYHSCSDEMVSFEIARCSASLLKNSSFTALDGEKHSSEKTVSEALTGIAKRLADGGPSYTDLH